MPTEFAGHTPEEKAELFEEMEDLLGESEPDEHDYEPERTPYSGPLPEKLWLSNVGSLVAFAGPCHAAQNIFEATWKTTNRVGDGTANRGEAEAIAAEIVNRWNAAPDLLRERDELREALDNLIGPGSQLETECDTAEHDEDGPCIFCEARALLARTEPRS